LTRICMYCDQIMGEKCSRCGAEAIPLRTNSNEHAVIGTDFDCPHCGHHFPQGDGGEVGGVCEPGFDEELRRQFTGIEQLI
jgi:DNA-directed RNA polymerase subunit RPC12/RpoP